MNTFDRGRDPSLREAQSEKPQTRLEQLTARVAELEEQSAEAERAIDKIHGDFQGDIMGGMAQSFTMPEGLQHDMSAHAKRKEGFDAELKILRVDLALEEEAQVARETYAENLTPFVEQVSTPGTMYQASGMDRNLKKDMEGGPGYGDSRFEMRDVIGKTVVILQPNYGGTMLRKSYGPIDVEGYIMLMPQVMDLSKEQKKDTGLDEHAGIKEFGRNLSREQMNRVAQAVGETARRIADPKQMGGIKLGAKAVFDLLSQVAEQAEEEIRNERE
jgi:hypothetical protein